MSVGGSKFFASSPISVDIKPENETNKYTPSVQPISDPITTEPNISEKEETKEDKTEENILNGVILQLHRCKNM